MMNRKNDIEFLERFRKKVDEYLFLGYAPPETMWTKDYDPEALAKVKRALQHPDFKELRRSINEMKPRVKRLLEECNLTPIIEQHPPPAVGGPVRRFHMLDVVTENMTEFNFSKDTVTDIIDQAIGALKHGLPPKVQAVSKVSSEQQYAFISHSSQDQDIIEAVRQGFSDLRVEPRLFEERASGGPPTKEIAKAVSGAMALFVFFTFNSISGETRDWIAFELGVAVAHEVSIYAWKLKHLQNDSLPRMLEQVTTYRDFEATTQGLFALTKEIRSVVKGLK